MTPFPARQHRLGHSSAVSSPSGDAYDPQNPLGSSLVLGVNSLRMSLHARVVFRVVVGPLGFEPSHELRYYLKTFFVPEVCTH